MRIKITVIPVAVLSSVAILFETIPISATAIIGTVVATHFSARKLDFLTSFVLFVHIFIPFIN